MKHRTLSHLSPFGALVRGVIAGAVGSFAQELFFGATAKIAPETPKDVFTPPEPEQKDETATQTVARRMVENVAQAGPLEDKERAGKLVHYAFGSAWGGVYGLLAGSSRLAGTLGASLAFGGLVWMASDNAILPAFKLAAPATEYPAKTHAYAIAAHLVYGAAVWAAFNAERIETWIPVIATVRAAWSTRKLPKPARAPARRIVRSLATANAALRVAGS